MMFPFDVMLIMIYKIIFSGTLMLSQSQIEALLALPIEQRQARYIELATKIAQLIILKKEELQELIILRDSLQRDADVGVKSNNKSKLQIS